MLRQTYRLKYTKLKSVNYYDHKITQYEPINDNNHKN